MSLFRSLRRWRRAIAGLALGLSLPLLFLLAARAQTAREVILEADATRLAVPLATLQSFGASGQAPPELANFIAASGSTPAEFQTWLTANVAPPVPIPLPADFILLQIDKVLGNPEQPEDLPALRQALKVAAEDEQFSVLEVLANYPQPATRLDVTRLQRTYTDIKLAVTRLTPVLELVEQLLPEIVCDCTPTEAAQAAYEQAQGQLHNALLAAPATSAETKAIAATPAVTEPAAFDPDKGVVFLFGPFSPSIAVGDLTTFAETGKLPPPWNLYLGLANIDRDDLRQAIQRPIAVRDDNLPEELRDFLGEYFLYEVGQVIQPPSGQPSIASVRTAILAAARDDQQFSVLELLQQYPAASVRIDGDRLARIGKTIQRYTGSDGLATATLDLEGWLLDLQASATVEVCDCAAGVGAPPDLPPLPAIAPTTRAQFLPPDWQPVEPQRRDRGPIKVVWLRGSPYEMGYQHGQLLHDEIASLGAEALNFGRLAGRGFGLARWASKRLPDHVVEECRGLVDATADLGITQDTCLTMAYADVYQEIFGYTLPQQLFWDGCHQFIASGAATADGRLYHGSSVDNATPVDYVLDHPTVFVRQPEAALPHVFVAYPGVVWPNSGLNVAGITLGLDTAHPNSPEELNFSGRSNVGLMAEILARATNFAEARAMMTEQPRVRANIIAIASGREQQAGVFEFTGRHLGVRSLPESGVLYATNHFVMPEMADKQAPISESSHLRFDRLQQLLEPTGTSSLYGRLAPATMVQVLRDRTNPATGETSPFSVFDDNASPGGNGALRQAIYDPSNLRFWVAGGEPPVPENPFACFSLGELLGFPDAAACDAPAFD